MFIQKSRGFNQNTAAQELSQVLNDWVNSGNSEAPIDKDLVFNMGEHGSEMLRVATDGFYVRGQRLPTDAREAETVYRAFREWLTWAHLSRD